MAEHLEFEAKTDRQLLLLTAQAVNAISKKLDVMNGTLNKHEKRITGLEINLHGKINRCVKTRNEWLPLAGRGGIIVAVVGGIIYGVGRGLGWWG